MGLEFISLKKRKILVFDIFVVEPTRICSFHVSTIELAKLCSLLTFLKPNKISTFFLTFSGRSCHDFTTLNWSKPRGFASLITFRHVNELGSIADYLGAVYRSKRYRIYPLLHSCNFQLIFLFIISMTQQKYTTCRFWSMTCTIF